MGPKHSKLCVVEIVRTWQTFEFKLRLKYSIILGPKTLIVLRIINCVCCWVHPVDLRGRWFLNKAGCLEPFRYAYRTPVLMVDQRKSSWARAVEIANNGKFFVSLTIVLFPLLANCNVVVPWT